MEHSPRHWFGIAGVLCSFLIADASLAQVAATANEEYRTHAQREKAAAEMDPPARGAPERTDLLVRSLDLHPGDSIADVGTGVGHLLSYIIREIGSSGTIFAVDIYPEFLDRVRNRIAAAGWQNVYPVLG